MRRSTFDAQFGDLMTSSDKMSIFFRESMYGENEMNYMSMTANFESGNVLSTLHELVKECASKAPFANLTSVCWTKDLPCYRVPHTGRKRRRASRRAR